MIGGITILQVVRHCVSQSTMLIHCTNDLSSTYNTLF